jgi:ribosomal protein L11 methyltransferase
MKYYQLNFVFEAQEMSKDILQTACDVLAGLAADAGLESFEDSEDGIIGYVQTDLFDKERLDHIMQEFPIPGVSVKYTIEDADYKDWNETWEAEGFEPIEIGSKCIIHDPHHPIEETVPNRLDIEIDAKMAFGTGTHETTRMVLEELLQIPLAKKRVLDCGCGTGILSIVASKAGASDVVAYDIDEWSVENTRHNAILNNVENLEVFTGDRHVLSHVSGVFDILMANINRNILLSDLPSFHEVMASGAKLILSGFYEEDTDSLIEKAQELGLKFISHRHIGEWAAITLSN